MKIISTENGPNLVKLDEGESASVGDYRPLSEGQACCIDPRPCDGGYGGEAVAAGLIHRLVEIAEGGPTDA